MNERGEIPKSLIYWGVGIAVLNMIMVWVFIAFSMFSTEANQLEKTLQGSADNMYRGKLFGTEIDLPREVVDYAMRSSTWDTQWELLIIAFSFSLIGIGFSLLVMGIRGTLSVSSEANQGRAVMLSASSPGLLCLFISILPLCLYIYLQDKPVDPVAEGQAEILRAKADLLQAQATADSELKYAEQLKIEAEANAKEVEAEANAELIRAKADSEYIP